MLKNRENYEIMTPESIGLNQVQLNLTSRSGRAAVKHRMEEMGYRERLQPDHLYDAFLKLADKKAVFDYDLEALAFINKQQEEPEHFRRITSTSNPDPAISPPPRSNWSAG